MILKLIYLGLSSFLILSIPILRRIYFSEGKEKSENNEILQQAQHKIKKRHDFFDYLRGLAILAVILIHIGDNFYVEGSGNILFIKFINNISRFAVPFFLICSGVLLLRAASFKKFIQKKIFRNFLPYLLLTMAVGVYYDIGVLKIIHGFFAGSASAPYYYMGILLQFYLLYPFLEKYSKKKYFLHITFLISIVSFFIEQTWVFYGIPLFPRYLFLFTYGISQKEKFLSEKFKLSLKEKTFWIMLVVYYVVFALYSQEYLYNIRVFYAIALFNLLFLAKDWIKNIPSYSLFCYLGRNSLWIYLIHFFIVQAIFPTVKQVSDNFYFQYIYFVIVGVPVSILFSLGFKYVYNLVFDIFTIKPVK